MHISIQTNAFFQCHDTLLEKLGKQDQGASILAYALSKVGQVQMAYSKIEFHIGDHVDRRVS